MGSQSESHNQILYEESSMNLKPRNRFKKIVGTKTQANQNPEKSKSKAEPDSLLQYLDAHDISNRLDQK